MSNYNQLDRVEVPIFYVPIDGCTTHTNCERKVFTPSSYHPIQGWISVGYVSKQTPLGQGTFLGFPVNQLRKATKEEVLTALNKNHPFGKGFRPKCEEASDIGFDLLMAGATANWTNDNAPNESIINISKKQLKDLARQASKHHAKLMRRWKSICKMQITAIQQSFA